MLCRWVVVYQAVSFLTEACHSSSVARESRAQALSLMADLLHRGQGTCRDEKRAVCLLKQAIEIAPAYALQLGAMLREGPIVDAPLHANGSNGSNSNDPQKITCKGGLPPSITEGGRERDNIAALGCFQKVIEHADRGDIACKVHAPLAYLALGKLYLEGAAGVARNVGRAYECFERSASPPHSLPEAQFLQGVMLRKGSGTDRNVTRGSELIRQAANSGVVPAMLLFGEMCRDGCGTTKERSLALMWLAKASEHGSIEARYEHAVLQGPALTVTRSIKKAGILTKMGAIIKNWKSRWFVLDQSLLCYYRDQNETSGAAPLGQIPLAGLSILTTHDISGKKGAAFTVKAMKESRVYTLLAGTHPLFPSRSYLTPNTFSSPPPPSLCFWFVFNDGDVIGGHRNSRRTRAMDECHSCSSISDRCNNNTTNTNVIN
jgi:TPR repeat protein